MALYDSLPETSFLKKLLTGEDPPFVERFLTIKHKFETETEKDQKAVARDQFVGLFWDLYNRVGLQISPSMPSAKRLFLRFGIVDMRYLSPEDQKTVLSIPLNPPDYSMETIYYADEWLQGIREGRLKPSSSDETGSKQQKPAAPTMVNPKREKFEALINVEKERYGRFLKDKDEAVSRLNAVAEHLSLTGSDERLGISGLLHADQLKYVDELSDIQKEIRRQHKEMAQSARSIEKAVEQLREIDSAELSASGAGNMGFYGNMTEIIQNEISCLRQMQKMTVGRQGNMFPILNSSLISKEAKSPLYKTYLKKRVEYWLELDPEAYNRTYRGEMMNIPPYTILMPGYGTIGVCWEPLDKDNRQFGKGRCAVGIFSRIPDVSVLSAIGDIRWQAAKEIASYYWMEEGLTGRYYEYYLSAKLKGDLRHLFITDYLLWMTKETQGVQKLDKDARYVFWRYVPLPDEKKIWLSKKGYYYGQLWDNEQTWRKGQESW